MKKVWNTQQPSNEELEDLSSLYKIHKKTNIKTRPTETAIDSAEEDYPGSVDVMTSKPSTISNNWNNLEQIPLNLRIIQQDHATSDEESFLEPLSPDSRPWTAEDRSHWLNEILE